jgi:hypothetical protein
MNRGIACLLFSVVSAIGCGARTGTLDSDPGGPVGDGGSGGALYVAGAPSFGGSPNFAGSPSFGGAPHFAGAPSFGGAPHFGGAPSFGGAPNFAGAPSFGGSPNFGGSPSFGGLPGFAGGPSFGGSAGSGGEGGVIINACVAIANNACDKCLCTSCAVPVVSCFSDAKCTSIFGCIVRTGCLGVGCYSDSTCRNTIDANGGLGSPALAEVFSIVNCAAQSQSNCPCN